MLSLPQNQRWYAFRSKWNDYKKTHKNVELEDLEDDGERIKVVLSPRMAWPLFVIGITLLVLAFLIHAQAIMVTSSVREDVNPWLWFIGLIVMVVSFLLFAKKK